MKAASPAKPTISSNLRAISARRHAEDHAIEEHVFTPGEIGMEARADLDQRR